MFSDIGGGEVLVVSLLGFGLALIPLVLVIWVIVILVRLQRSVDRIAAAIERGTGLPPRGP